MARFMVRNPVLVGSMLSIPKQYIPDIEAIKQELTIPNGAAQQGKAFGQKGKVLYFEEFSETASHLEVPRHFELPDSLAKLIIMDRRNYPSINSLIRMRVNGYVPTCVKECRDEIQKEALKVLLELKGQDRSISLACGRGKSYLALKTVCETQEFPCLIVVNTESLMEQWIKAIKEFCDVDPEDIGVIQGDKCSYEGKFFTIAMIHSLTRRNYGPEMGNYFRVVIADELHRLGATDFSRAAGMFSGARIGLSATMKRPDGNDRLIRLHFGPVRYANLEQDIAPTVYMVHTGIPAVNEHRFIPRGSRTGEVSLPIVNTYLSRHSERNELILSYLSRAIRDNRTILFLGERVEQLIEFRNYLQERHPNTSIAILVGTLKKAQKVEALKAQVVLATQNLGNEGLDKPEIDTLIIPATYASKNRMQQASGRSLRVREGKKKVVIVIFVDENIGIMKAMGKKMARYFAVERQYKTVLIRANKEEE